MSTITVGDRVTYRWFRGTQIVGTVDAVDATRVHVVYPPSCGWESRWEDVDQLRRHEPESKQEGEGG